MQANDLDRETLRRLATAKADNGSKAISLYLNLEPAHFATPPARASAIRSLLDEGERKLKEVEDGHANRPLRQDFERVREFFAGDLPTDGARGLAVFCSGAAGLFEVIRLPRPVESEVVISDSPFVEPLVDLTSGSWCVFLCNRRHARILRGGRDRLEEVWKMTSDDVLSRHDQGGLSQARYQRGVDEEAHRHLRRAAEQLHRRFRRVAFDHLLIGATEEWAAEVEAAIHSDLRQRLRGRVSVDVEHTSTDEVFAAAQPAIEVHEAQRERDALDRMSQGIHAGGRGAAGLEDVLGVLNERRVATLLLEERFRMPGAKCPQCGSLYGDEIASCPADQTATERCDDVVEEAVELALAQDAEVIVARHHDDLEQMGGIGAVLRF